MPARLPFPARRASALCLTLACCGSAMAQDTLPQRKPGLWEHTMQMPDSPMPPGAMNSRLCVDAASDAEMQRKAMADRHAKCSPPVVKRGAGQTEVRTECSSAQGRTQVVSTMRGDFKSAYHIDSQMSFDPPRHGRKEMRMAIDARYVGACPADMKPGDIRMANGLTVNPAQAGKPGTIDPNAVRQMTPEQLKALAEQMRKQRQP